MLDGPLQRLRVRHSLGSERLVRRLRGADELEYRHVVGRRRESMTDAPVVALGLPLYNSVDALRGGARVAARRRRWRTVAVVIVDDASTDGTAEVAQRIAGRDARVHYQRNPRRIGLVSQLAALLSSDPGAASTGALLRLGERPRRLGAALGRAARRRARSPIPRRCSPTRSPSAVPPGRSAAGGADALGHRGRARDAPAAWRPPRGG